MQLVQTLIAGWLISSVSIGHAASPGSVKAFVSANVVPMDTETLLPNQTVVIADGIIVAIGEDESVEIPDGAEIIDADGKFLMPGLADMHTHLTGEASFIEGAEQLPHYIEAGVTTIRALSASPESLELRDAIERGESIGPTIYTSGHTLVGMPGFLFLERIKLAVAVAVLCVAFAWMAWLALRLACRLGHWSTWRRARPHFRKSLLAAAAVGVLLVYAKVVPVRVMISRMYPWVYVVETESDARAAVRAQKEAGYDLIKIYDYLTEDVAVAMLDEAQKLGMYSVGHLADEIPIATLLDAGLREVAHADELIVPHMGQQTDLQGFQPVPFNYDTIGDTVGLIESHDVFVVSNLVADEVSYLALEDPEAWLQRPEYEKVPETTRQRWLAEGRWVDWKPQAQWRRDTMQPFLKTMVKALSDAGVKLLVGTDVSVQGILPEHLHRDLEILVEAGLTPYQALEAGTKNAALSVARMGKPANFGTVAIGNRADLLLLDANPLDDISATTERVGVMVRGRWFPNDERVRSQMTALVNVNVIAMTRADEVLEQQTVLIEGPTIVEIGPVDAVTIPEGAEVIEGNGKFVIPGLSDMHVHMYANEDLLPLMLAHGVTTIRIPNATPEDMALAEEIAAGTKVGPSIYSAPLIAGIPPDYAWLRWAYRGGVVVLLGAMVLLVALAYQLFRGRPLRVLREKLLVGFAITAGLAALSIGTGTLSMRPLLWAMGVEQKIVDSPEAAADLVREHHANGADGIKTQWWLTRPMFDAIVETAKELGLSVIGHIPKEVGVEHYIASGAEPQHDYQLFAYAAKDYQRHYGPNPLDRFDLSEADTRLPKLAALMKQSGSALTPTMLIYEHVFQTLNHLDDIEAAPMFRDTVYKHVPSGYLHGWTDPHGEELTIVTKASGAQSPAELKPTLDYQRTIQDYTRAQTKALFDAGVPILAGTDCSVFGIVWGASLHRELELMVESGLTPYEALATATTTPAHVLGDDHRWGSLEKGKRADLVLLNGNPLEDIRSTRKIAGVMVRGRFQVVERLRDRLIANR